VDNRSSELQTLTSLIQDSYHQDYPPHQPVRHTRFDETEVVSTPTRILLGEYQNPRPLAPQITSRSLPITASRLILHDHNCEDTQKAEEVFNNGQVLATHTKEEQSQFARLLNSTSSFCKKKIEKNTAYCRLMSRRLKQTRSSQKSIKP
jgi:hypothetical protein